MEMENGGFDPENLENKQDNEPSRSGLERQVSRRSVIRAGIGAAALFMGRSLVKHDKAAAQEATSPMIEPGTGPTEVSNGATSAISGGDAESTSPMIVPVEGSTVVPNADTLVNSGDNPVATSPAIEPVSTNDGRQPIEIQTTPAATTEAASTSESAGSQDNQEGHDSGLLTKKDLVKGAVGLWAGAVIGAAIKGKKREGG